MAHVRELRRPSQSAEQGQPHTNVYTFAMNVIEIRRLGAVVARNNSTAFMGF